MLFFFGHVTNQVSFQCLQFAWKRPSTNPQGKRKNNYRKNKYFHVYGQKQPVANLSVVDFRSQLRKHTIAWVKYVTFNFSSRIQFYFRFQEILSCYGFSQGGKSFLNTAVYVIIFFLKLSYKEKYTKYRINRNLTFQPIRAIITET